MSHRHGTHADAPGDVLDLDSLDLVAALERTHAVLHEADGTAQRILDVAERTVLSRGTAGLHVAELARAAGVSRPTFYRRWESREAIIESLVVRHLVGCVDAIGGPVAGTREEITTKLTDFADAFFADPVLTHLGAHEPDIFARYALQQISPVHVLIIGWIQAAVEAAQQHGSVRAGDPYRTAVMLLLVMQSTILTYPAAAPLIQADDWKPELTLLLDGYLRP